MTFKQYAKKHESLYQREQTLRQYAKHSNKNARKMWDCIVAQYKLSLRYFKSCRRSGTSLINVNDIFEDRLMMIRYSIGQRNKWSA